VPGGQEDIDGKTLNMKSHHPIRPPFWARGGHLQTLLGHFLRKGCDLTAGEDIDIPLPDGDVLAGHLLRGESDTVVYLFHGLGGSIGSGYMMRTAKLCRELGHTVIRVNHRGCGRGAELTHQYPYHSGRGEDLSEAIAFGRKRYPEKRHVAIGFSLSGNALLLLASGERGQIPPDAAIAVNAPIELAVASKKLTQGLNRLYGFVFVQDCRRDVLHKQKKGWLGKELTIPYFANIAEFDELYTGPRAGFKNRDHYYEMCSSARHLHRIKIPTVLITAQDDPFVDVSDYLKAKLSPSTRLIVSETGGHMGYLVQGKGWFRHSHWLEDQIARSLTELGFPSHTQEPSREA
jgi:predicted alpha/beta-fold hydrolase